MWQFVKASCHFILFCLNLHCSSSWLCMLHGCVASLTSPLVMIVTWSYAGRCSSYICWVCKSRVCYQRLVDGIYLKALTSWCPILLQLLWISMDVILAGVLSVPISLTKADSRNLILGRRWTERDPPSFSFVMRRLQTDRGGQICKHSKIVVPIS